MARPRIIAVVLHAADCIIIKDAMLGISRCLVRILVLKAGNAPFTHGLRFLSRKFDPISRRDWYLNSIQETQGRNVGTKFYGVLPLDFKASPPQIVFI